MGSGLQIDTDELLRRIQQGDAAARSELFSRHRDRLRRMVAVRLDRRLLSRLDPSDVVQEALAEAAQKLAEYLRLRPVPFYPWLRQLAWEHLVRLHDRHLRAQRRNISRERPLEDLSSQSSRQLAGCLARPDWPPDHRLVHAELKVRLLAALARLSETDRELLVLRYLEDLSNGEIAAILRLQEGAVRTRHTRALARLARHIRRLDQKDST